MGCVIRILAASRVGVTIAARAEDRVGLGVVDIKDNRIETANEIACAIEHTRAQLRLDRIRYVNPDCGF
jgi:methionine synthase II (cobalamin-independent)